MANDRGFVGKVEFVEKKASGYKTGWKDRKVKKIIDDLEKGDLLIVPEMSRLGRSMLDILQLLSICKEKGIDVHAVKGNWSLNGTIESKIIMTIYAMAAEIERDLISQRTKEGLRVARSKGKMLGRPKGSGRSKLDKYRPEIEALLKNGSPKEEDHVIPQEIQINFDSNCCFVLYYDRIGKRRDGLSHGHSRLL